MWAEPSGPALNLGAVVSGILATFLFSLLAAGLVALAVLLTPLTETQASVGLFALGLISLALGAGVGARRASGRGWVHGLLVGLGYVVCSLALEPAFFPGSLTLAGSMFRLALGAVTGLLGGVVALNL